MVELTPELAGTSLVFMLVSYVVVLIFNIYMLYLNWKQSKVKEITAQLLAENKKTNVLLQKLLDKSSKKK